MHATSCSCAQGALLHAFLLPVSQGHPTGLPQPQDAQLGDPGLRQFINTVFPGTVTGLKVSKWPNQSQWNTVRPNGYFWERDRLSYHGGSESWSSASILLQCGTCEKSHSRARKSWEKRATQPDDAGRAPHPGRPEASLSLDFSKNHYISFFLRREFCKQKSHTCYTKHHFRNLSPDARQICKLSSH